MTICLIGYRGSGKTTIARILAERLGWDWGDCDAEIEREAGATIADIFANQGEPAFRDLERSVLLKLVQRDRFVIATGGGIVLREENRAAMKGTGPVIWLNADPQTLWNRISQDPSTGARRPNLTPAGGFAEVEAIVALRTPLYRAAADCEIETHDKSPDQVMREILEYLAARHSRFSA